MPLFDVDPPRTRNMVLTGRIELLNRVWKSAGIPPAGFLRYAKAYGKVVLNIGGVFNSRFFFRWNAADGDYSGSEIEVSCTQWGLASTTATDAVHLGGLSVDYGETITGDFTLVIPVKTSFEVQEGTLANWCSPDIYGFPQYGGASDETSQARQIRFLERTTGEDATYVFVLGGNAIKGTVTPPADQEIFYDCNVDFWASALDYSGTHDLVMDWVDDFRIVYGGSDTVGLIGVSAGSYKARAYNQGAGHTSKARVLATDRPADKYDFGVRCSTFDIAYPGALNVNMATSLAGEEAVAVSGRYAVKAFEQDEWTAAGQTIYDETLGTEVINNFASDYRSERAPIYARMSDAELTARGEDARNWRIFIHGRDFDSYDLSQLGSYYVTHADSLVGWSNVANAALSLSGGYLRADVSGGSGEIKFVPSGTDPTNWECYRYLRFQIMSVSTDNEPWTLTVSGKSWSGTTGVAGVWTTIDIDLCCPHSTSQTVSTQETRWPLTAAGAYPATNDDLWGVSEVSELHFSGLTNGASYQFRDIRLRRDSFAKISFLPPYRYKLQPYPDVGATTTLFWVGTFLDCDGRWTDPLWYQTKVQTGGIITYGETSLTYSIVTEWPNMQGWTATAVGTFPADGYHDNGRPSLWAGGAGEIYLWSSRSWAPWFNKSAESITVRAQALWDQVQGFPGAGGKGCWDGTAFDTADPYLDVVAKRFFRGQFRGLGFKTTDVPNVGAQVVAYKSSDSADVIGTGTTDIRGEYWTGIPYGKGHDDYTAEFRVGTPPYLNGSHELLDGKRAVVSFRKDSASGTGPFLLRDPFARLMKTKIIDGDLWFYRSDSSTPLPAWAVTVQVTSHHKCVQRAPIWVEDSGQVVVYFVKEDPAATFNVYEVTSSDDGETWEAETLAIASGRFVDVDRSQFGAVLRAAIVYQIPPVDRYYIVGQLREVGGASFGGSFTFLDDVGNPLEAENEGFKVRAMDDGAQVWILSVRIRGESDTSDWWSGDEGRSWTRY